MVYCRRVVSLIIYLNYCRVGIRDRSGTGCHGRYVYYCTLEPELFKGIVAVAAIFLRRSLRWLRLSEQIFRLIGGATCRVQAAAICGSGVK